MNWDKVSVSSAKIEATVDTTAENVSETFAVTRSGYHNGAWEEYNLAEKLGDGEIIAYTMKFNDGHGLWMGASENDLWEGEDTYLRPDTAADFVGSPSDMYFQNKFGGTEVIGLASHGGTVGKVTAMNKSPFTNKGIEGTYIDKTNPNRYDVEYDIMYARVDGVIYMFVKYGTQENYTLVSKSNWTLPETEVSVQLIYSGRGGHKVDITYKNFSLKQNAQEEIRTLVEKNLVGDCIFDGESGTAVVNGDGQLTSLTGGTLAYEQNGDFIVWDTDTIGDATKGKFFIEGNFTAWGGYNAKNEWKRHQGAGFVLKQMATGKMITIEPSYQTNSELLIQVSEGNGWNTRATLGAKNAPTGENAISFQTEAVASKTNPAKYYMRAEVEGYVWKIWIGKDESTIDFSKPTWEVDMYAHLSTAPGGHGSGSQWSGNSNATKNREDKFPFIADTADGKYKAEGSNTWSAGNICMGYVAFGDAGTAGGCIVSNGSINYVSYDEITAVAKSEALAEIEEYATSLSFTLTDVEKAPIIAMESYKDKAVAVEEAKALIFFTDYKADALAFVSAYATEQGVVLSEEEDAYIKALINDSLTKEEIDANKGRAIALIDAEKNADGSILGVAVKVDEAKQYISDIIAETKEKGITDYAKNMLDEFGAQAITYLDSLYNVETIDQDIAQGKKWTDDMCTAVQMKFTVTILDAKGEVAEEIKDVLFGTEVASLLEGKVASAKEDDKGGLGEYVFKSWSYETEDGVVGGNLEITPEYTYSYYSLTISGSAVDANGNALAGATVVITNAEGATYEGVTDESGAYSIEASLGEINVQISKVGYLARATSTTNGVDKKDGETAIGVMAIANGVIDHSAVKAMKASYEYTDDLASAVVNNLQLDFAAATGGFVYETADVLDKNTYYKFTTKFNGASEDKLAHGINVKTNKYYTTVKKTLTGSNANAGTTVGQVVDNYVFADVAFKMGVGGTFDQGGHTVKVNGQGGEAMTSDKWFYGYSAQSSIPADRQFNIVNDSPFEAFYEKAYRTFVEDTSKYNPNYDIEYDMMYVKDAEGKVKLYGRLGGSVHGWVLMAESKTAIEGKNLIIAQSTRSGEWYINETVKNIESGAIDTETGLPAGEKIDEYLYNTDNASVVRDAEGKETYVLDLTGYAEVTNDGWNQLARGGNGAFAKAYSIKDSYDYLNDGILTLEGKFNAQDGHTGGALTGFYIQDANETGRFYYLGVKSNGGVGLAFANGNGSGWRIFHLQNKACDYFSINKDKLLTWNNGNAKDFYLKGVFEGNKISYYISTEGMPEVSEENWFFTITDLVKLVETQFDTSANAASAIANRMPNSAVNAGIYFNHEGGRGIDRVVVTDFKATYKTSADLLNDAKEEAKKELAIYAESKGVSVVEAMTSKIDAVTSIDGIPSALDAAKQVVDFFASHPEDAEELLDIVGNAIAEIDTAYAGVDKDTLTAKGIEDLDATVAESKATINAIDSVDGAQATADGAVKAVKDKIAQVTGEVVVAFGDNEVTVKYGTLISSIDVSTFTAPTKEDDKGGIGTYQFDKWAVADDAVATAEVTNVEAEFIYNYYAVTVSGTAVDYAGAKLAGVEVSIKHESGAVYTGVTDENGAYSIEALLGASDITWSTPEILDAASRYADINKAYVYARTAKIDADVSVKDAVKTVDVALAYGMSSSNKTVVASGTYSDDLSDATVEGLSYDVNGYILNPAFRTGAVLKENTYYKFTVNFHDGSDGNPAHNIHNSGKYTNASNQFADIGLKMVVGKKAIKVNGKNGGVLACDQYCQDYVNDAANANATSQFSRTPRILSADCSKTRSEELVLSAEYLQTTISPIWILCT
ncbi:MAG: carboxypeptidase regulatory-like domain-containing protein [Clostridia bacterium]|nr:carboxypeptidase regulatory-like domain-containing protein [Clostridia bacterium]